MTTNCLHLGKPTNELIKCASCKGNVQLKVYNCDVNGVCTQGKRIANVAGCDGCERKQSKITSTSVRVNLPSNRHLFNCGMVEWRGKTYLLARENWIAASIWIWEIGDDFQPMGEGKRLNTNVRGAKIGSEDPRAIVFDDRIYVFFTGYPSGKKYGQMYCRLNEDLSVDQVFAPDYQIAKATEKNWVPFVHDGELHSVYSVSPHVILRHDGNEAHPIAATKCPIKINAALRGGCPPARVGDEYYHWFHTSAKSADGVRYGIGLYTFEARWPFKIKRRIDEILFSTDEKNKQGQRIVYPGGALLRNGEWQIAYGFMDRECRVMTVDADQIEQLLQPGRD